MIKFGVVRPVASALVFALCGPAAAPALADDALTSVFRFYQSTTEADVIFGDAGYLFGTTNSYSVGHGGTIFKVRPDGTDVQTVYQLGALDGISPNSGLLKASDGNYYGTTQFSSRGAAFAAVGNGSIYQLKTNSGAPSYTTLHVLDPAANPLNPDGSFVLIAGAGYVRGSDLIEADGSLYGITPYGGAHGTGAAYSFPLSNPTTQPVFYSFNAVDSNGHNDGGVQPSGSLIKASDGNFYGTAMVGGANGAGAVFKLTVSSDLSSATVTSVLDFSALDSTNHSDCGTAPQGGVIEANGALYGTTSAGGSSGYGTVFKIVLSQIPSSGAFTCGASGTTFSSFTGDNGYSPVAELIKDSRDNNTLLGTSLGTPSVASVPYGNIFKVDISQDPPVVTTLVNLDATHGATPHTRLLQSSDGATLYGTAATGGGDYCTSGTVYRYGPSGQTDAGTPCPSSHGGGSMTPAILLLLSSLGFARRFVRRFSITDFGLLPPRTATRKRIASGHSLS